MEELGPYQSYKKELQDRAKAEKEKALEALTKAGVGFVQAEYDGEGDSGMIEAIEFCDSDDFESGAKKLDVSEEIKELTLDFMYSLLEAEYGGWEINDGSFGVIELNVAKRTGKIENNARYVSFEYSELEF